MILSLTDLQTYFVGVKTHDDRWARIDEWTTELGYKPPVKFMFPAQPMLKIKYEEIRVCYIKALRGMTSFPGVLFEDDATPTQWYKNEFEVPDDAGIVYLGGSVHGAKLSPGGFLKYAGRELAPHSEHLVRIINMQGTHAILFVTEEARNEFLDIVEHDPYDMPHDFHLSVEQRERGWLALREPLFYQADGRNDAWTNHLIDI